MMSIRALPALAVLSALPALAGERDDAWFRSESALVLVPVTVTDHRGATINGLKPDLFSLFEDHSPQPILTFSEQDTPCSVGVILDLSGSMKQDIVPARAILRAFLELADSGDEALLMSVSDRPVIHTGFSGDMGTLLDTALATKIGGSTALVDTLYLALERMRGAHTSRKALLVISDGMDNHSQYNVRELMSAALEVDVRVHTIAIDRTPRNRKAIETAEWQRGLAFLSDLSQRTGGQYFLVRGSADIAAAVSNISKALRNQYVLGYRPSGLDQTGKWHAIQVKIGVPKAHVYARRGYYSR
jgi:Ca-activated chloride channel family protein